MRRRLLVCFALLAVAGASAGALVIRSVLRDDPAARVCTLIGSSDSVVVSIPHPPEDFLAARACLAGRCLPLDRYSTMPPTVAAAFGLRSGLGPRIYGMTLVLERRGHRPIVRATRIRLRRFEPNGPGCGTWWRATVVFRHGRLEQV